MASRSLAPSSRSGSRSRSRTPAALLDPFRLMNTLLGDVVSTRPGDGGLAERNTRCCKWESLARAERVSSSSTSTCNSNVTAKQKRDLKTPWTLASLSLVFSPQTTICVPGKTVLGETMSRYLLTVVAVVGLAA